MNKGVHRFWYLKSCRKHEVEPDSAALSCFTQAKLQSFQNEKLSIAISLDQLKDTDILPIKDVLMSSDSAHIDAVDLFLEFHSDLGKECIVDLMQGISKASSCRSPRFVFGEGISAGSMSRLFCLPGLELEVYSYPETHHGRKLPATTHP